MKKTICTLGSCVFALCSLLCCRTTQVKQVKSAPYAVSVRSTLEHADGIPSPGIAFTFFNAAALTVKSFTIVFFVCNEDEDSLSTDSHCVIVHCDELVEAGEEYQGFVELDEYGAEPPDEPYRIESFYVSMIVYDDGSRWKDRFGFWAP